MELIQDLLRPESDNLILREDPSSSVFVAGLHEVPVHSLEECLHYLALGEQNRCGAGPRAPTGWLRAGLDDGTHS